MRRWKLVHATEELKVIDTIINILLDNENDPSEVTVKFLYYEKE
jgi:hypothetical protein